MHVTGTPTNWRSPSPVSSGRTLRNSWRSAGGAGVTVFYDLDKTIEFWGRNFIFEFRKVYGGTQPRFVMPFISAEYLAKPYPMDEFAAAVEQEFQRGDAGYILPVIVGDVTVPPEILNPAIGYLVADDHTPAQLADKVVAKLTSMRSAAVPALRQPQVPPLAFDRRAALTSTLDRFAARLAGAASILQPYGYDCHVNRDPSGVDITVDRDGRPICGLSLWFDTSLAGQDGLAMSFAWPSNDRHRFNGWIQADWAAHATVLRYQDFSAGHEEVLTVDQVVERLWDKIVTFVERRSG